MRTLPWIVAAIVAVAIATPFIVWNHRHGRKLRSQLDSSAQAQAQTDSVAAAEAKNAEQLERLQKLIADTNADDEEAFSELNDFFSDWSDIARANDLSEERTTALESFLDRQERRINSELVTGIAQDWESATTGPAKIDVLLRAYDQYRGLSRDASRYWFDETVITGSNIGLTLREVVRDYALELSNAALANSDVFWKLYWLRVDAMSPAREVDELNRTRPDDVPTFYFGRVYGSWGTRKGAYWTAPPNWQVLVCKYIEVPSLWELDESAPPPDDMFLYRVSKALKDADVTEARILQAHLAANERLRNLTSDTHRTAIADLAANGTIPLWYAGQRSV